MRAAHAASALGFLGRDGQVGAWESGQWLRLSCPGGSVLVRSGGTALADLGGFDVLDAFRSGDDRR
jgi:hypothetical protein